MKRLTLLGALLAATNLGSCSATPPPKAQPQANPNASASTAPAPERKHKPIDQSQFLSAFEVATSDALAPGELELLLAENYAGASFGEISARRLLLEREANGRLRVRNQGGYPASVEPVQSRERRCSFVVDCDDLAVRGLVAELRAAHASIAPSDVIRYVYDFIEHKHMARGFDIASVVAQKREGDCTEHAVLTAALLRATGFPTHVVTGLVLVHLDGKWAAFGHAWTEYHDGEHWQLADATNAGPSPEKLVYLPLRVMKDEGPAYARGLFDDFDVIDLVSVVVPTRKEP